MVALFRGSYHRSVGHPFIKTQDLDIRPGPRPRPRPRQDKSRPRQGQDKTKTKTRQVKAKIQMYRGILPQSDSDWGELLFKFELGLFSGMRMSTTTPQTSTWYAGVSATCISNHFKSPLGHTMLICNPALL